MTFHHLKTEVSTWGRPGGVPNLETFADPSLWLSPRVRIGPQMLNFDISLPFYRWHLCRFSSPARHSISNQAPMNCHFAPPRNRGFDLASPGDIPQLSILRRTSTTIPRPAYTTITFSEFKIRFLGSVLLRTSSRKLPLLAASSIAHKRHFFGHFGCSKLSF